MYKVAVMCAQGSALVQITQAVRLDHLGVVWALLPTWSWYGTKIQFPQQQNEETVINMNLSVWSNVKRGNGCRAYHLAHSKSSLYCSTKVLWPGHLGGL